MQPAFWGVLGAQKGLILSWTRAANSIHLKHQQGGGCLELRLGRDFAATGPGLWLMEQYLYHERAIPLLDSLPWKAPPSGARPGGFPNCCISPCPQIYLESMSNIQIYWVYSENQQRPPRNWPL